MTSHASSSENAETPAAAAWAPASAPPPCLPRPRNRARSRLRSCCRARSPGPASGWTGAWPRSRRMRPCRRRGIDRPDGVALPQPLDLRDDLTVEVRVGEPEHDELNRSDGHRLSSRLQQGKRRAERPGVHHLRGGTSGPVPSVPDCGRLGCGRCPRCSPGPRTTCGCQKSGWAADAMKGAGPPLLVIPGSCSGCSHHRFEEAPRERTLRRPPDRRDGSAPPTVGVGAHDRDRGHLETVRISNDPEYLAQVMARAGEAPEVVLEAAYGWYWAADTLAELGATVHLAHPLGVKMFSYRRVKNDQRDAADLADLLRMGRLPEAWIAPPATRELRGWVRHRAKLVGLRSSLKCQVHGVLAHAGIWVPMSDLFGVAGQQLLAELSPGTGYRSSLGPGWTPRCGSSVRWSSRSSCSPSWSTAGCAPTPATGPAGIPGVGPVLAAVFVAEIGDITRFHRPEQLASWAGLIRNTTSPTRPCTGAGSRNRVRGWCAGRRSRPSNASAAIPGWATPGSGRCAARPQHRRRGRRP